jgi:pimeloyl-CoA synthetase
MRKFKGLTMEQHLQIAADLLAMQEKARQMLHQVSDAYGVSKKVTKTSYKLLGIVNIFKSDMDTAYFDDINPKDSHSPYYPGVKKSEGR